MKAKDREEFSAAWKEHIDNCMSLAASLPSKEALEVLDLVKRLRNYIDVAADHTYGGT